ncbi:MAG TPA: hypothetical protein IAA54_02535 [Candidatus Gallacutalibacter pullicola]|uniref:Oxaloacetate decarboxylase n=1 Tax=Candidatus Gallacutalibacter pullicola TaxID=2840830 RepID=A0A9D1DPG0_9FIRM|nr:hypothetical protein [Candidatus Gallacutalibacter pullicola]
MNFNLLSVLYTTPLGPVDSESLINSLKLMGLGMVGILVVMILIYAVIVILNKTTRDKDQK